MIAQAVNLMNFMKGLTLALDASALPDFCTSALFYSQLNRKDYTL